MNVAELDDIPRPDNAVITFEYHNDIVRDCSLHPELTIAATSCFNGHIYVWHTQTGQILFNLTENSTSCVSFNYDGRYLAVGLLNGHLLVYSINENAELNEMFQQVVDKITHRITWMCWYRSEYIIVTGGTTHIRIWYVPSGACRVLADYPHGPGQFCSDGILTRDDKKLYVTILDGHLQLWDLTTDTIIMGVNQTHPMMHSVGVCALACDASADFYISAAFDGKILFCKSNGPFYSLNVYGGPPCMALSPLNVLKLIVIATASGLVYAWDYLNQEMHWMIAIGEGVECMKWLCEHFIVIPTREGSIYGIDVLMCALKFTLFGHVDSICTIDYNPHTRIALTGSFDTNAKIFQIPDFNA